MRVDPERTLTRPPKEAGMVALARRVSQDGTVQTAYENGTGPVRPAWRATPRPPLVRQRQGKVIAGVAMGLAEHLGLPVVAVRVALVLTSIPFGAGLVVYVFLWATMREVGDVDPAVSSAPTLSPGGPIATGPASAGTMSGSPGVRQHHVDLAGLRTWLRSGNQAVIITLLGVAALAVAGALWLGGAWLVVGLGLTILGLVGLLVRGTNLTELWQVAGAVLAALVGVAVLSAPWILRLWSNLRLEQAARIRATERADIAAHLHDSVLQTLALIQRQSGDAAAVARLARAQERQLRSYLYDEDARAGTLGAALTAAMGEVEDLHGVPVQLVVTGDRPMDAHLDALVKAVREATWNAVRHASPPVSTYVEVGPDAVEAFVRDHGAGFDLDTVPDDRAGVRESIIGRMERHGGTARIRRRADGTEIELRLPVGDSDTATPTPAATPTSTPESTPAPAPVAASVTDPAPYPTASPSTPAPANTTPTSPPPTSLNEPQEQPS